MNLLDTGKVFRSWVFTDGNIGIIKLNTSEVCQRVQDSDLKGPLRNPRAWSGQLNLALGKGLREAAYTNLVKKAGLFDKGYLPFIAALDVAEIVGDPGNWGQHVAGDVTGIAATGLAVQGIVRGVNQIYNEKKGLPSKEIVFSMMPFMHLDRVADVAIETRLSPLVCPIEKSE